MEFDIDLSLEQMLEYEACIYAENDGVPTYFITDHGAHSADLRRIVNVVESVVKYGKPLFLPNRKTVRKGVRVTTLEMEVLSIIGIDPTIIKGLYPRHQFNPVVSAFFKFEKGLADQISDRSYGSLSKEDNAILHGFVDDLVAEVKAESVQAKLTGFKRAANKAYKGLGDLIESLFDRYSRLLVIRLDLGYRNEYCTPTGLLGVSYEESKKHREDLLKYFRTKMSPSIVGYAWKLEYGLAKTYHYHFLLFFDGATSRQDIVIAQAVGEYWSSCVTGGKGIYHNCNNNKADYKARGILGIGMVSHDDLDLRNGLKTAAAYLTKVDVFVRMMISGGGRCFGKSGRPKVKKSGRGRPRRNSIEPTAQSDSIT
ncbi:inovirus-type Gp2 protein [Pseudomonas sp. O11]|uniref:YagK/YfjJ domain-containing protein n=1 Tax=Pseudomonas sp. O11 TaxID=3159446 RepID=UPI00387B2832